MMRLAVCASEVRPHDPVIPAKKEMRNLGSTTSDQVLLVEHGKVLQPRSKRPHVRQSLQPAEPQSLRLCLQQPTVNIDPTGLECVWDDGSYDSNDDSSTGDGARDGSGNHTGCSGQGGTWIDHSYFTSNNMADWSGQANAGLADMITPSATVTFNYDASWAAAYLNNWAQGNLPTSIQYGQNDPATLAMVNRPLVQAQLAAYKAAGCLASSPAGQGSGDAYKETAGDVASGNPNYVQAEVGGYSGHFNTSEGVTTITLSNVSGASSFFGYSAAAGAINTATGSHINRNGIDRTSGPMQNVTQTFTQTMPSPCGGG